MVFIYEACIICDRDGYRRRAKCFDLAKIYIPVELCFGSMVSCYCWLLILYGALYVIFVLILGAQNAEQT